MNQCVAGPFGALQKAGCLGRLLTTLWECIARRKLNEFSLVIFKVSDFIESLDYYRVTYFLMVGILKILFIVVFV